MLKLEMKCMTRIDKERSDSEIVQSERGSTHGEITEARWLDRSTRVKVTSVKQYDSG